MSDKKLAVFFPGVGYTNDKPLLYYSRKLAEERGYEVICTEYHDLPGKIKGNKEKMMHVPLYTYPGCNHSLECSSWKRNIEILGKVMELTETYMLETGV